MGIAHSLMIHRKTPEEIKLMQHGGRMLGEILQKLLDFSQPGVELMAIDREADRLIAECQAIPSFKTVNGYGYATCLCPNEVVVHGVPTGYILKDGDVLTIDIGLIYMGFHTDTAWTKIVGSDTSSDKDRKVRFLASGQNALAKAIDLACVGAHVGDISRVVQTVIEGSGYNVVKSLVGHGVGRELHEEPQIPNYVRGNPENTYKFQGGETIAIEPIYVEGEGSVVYENDDGWTMATRDRSLAAVFEHSVAITPEGPVVLTRR